VPSQKKRKEEEGNTKIKVKLEIKEEIINKN
jgi:hypothetical protein